MSAAKNIFNADIEQTAFRKIKDLKESQNLSYGEIAQILKKEGFSGSGDSDLTQPTVSRFMIEHGYRVLDRKSRKKESGRKPMLVKESKQERPKVEGDLQHDLMLAVSTNFSKTGQALILDTLIQAFKKEAGV